MGAFRLNSEQDPEHERPAPRAPAPDLGRHRLLALQRTAGNQAVTRLIQRSPESKKALTALAAPQIFPGPEFDAQQRVGQGLDAAIDKLEGWDKLAYNISCVGGIRLTALPGPLRDVVAGAQLIELPQARRAVGKSSFNMVQDAGLANDVVLNTLTTMEAAGQLDYLRKSNLIDDQWEVLVEVHYYRDRDPNATGFHKDSKGGQSLFVNLNFMNEQEIAGPEILINPYVPQEQADKRAQTLPGVFQQDLAAAMEAHKDEGGTVYASRIPKHGVVAFVDEAVHHKTPTLRHREATAETIRTSIEKRFGLDADSLGTAFDSYNNRGFFNSMWSFGSYINKLPTQHAEATLAFLTALDDQRRYNRHDLAPLIPQGYPMTVDEFVDQDVPRGQGEIGDFGRAGIEYLRGVEQFKGGIPVKEPGKPPLKRTMSEMLDRDEAPKAMEGKRRFFRTWVRVVPRGYFE